MKKRAWVFVAAVLLGTASMAEAEEPVASTITGVVLYTDTALVTREVTMHCASGVTAIPIEVKAFSIDPDSVTANVRGDGEIYSVQYKEKAVTAAPDERLETLRRKIEDLNSMRRVLADEKEVTGKKETFLASLLDYAKVEVPREIKTAFPKAEELQGALAFIETNYSAIDKKRQEVDLKLRSLDKEIEAATRELNALQAPKQNVRKVIEVVFNSKKAQDVKIEATYIARNASWQPSYKVDAALDLKTVTMVMFAMIRQATGEDWKDAAVTLSNVIPLRGMRLPTLESWKIDIIRPMPQVIRGVSANTMYSRAQGRMQLEKKAAMTDYDGMAAEEAMPVPAADFAMAEAREMPTAFEYEFGQKLSIASGEAETLLPVLSKTLKGDFYYYAVPKGSPLTFLVCKASSTAELLAAPLNIYFGGRYVGQTFLEAKRPGEDFEINLGADRGVPIKREKTLDKVDEAFFGKLDRQTVLRHIAYKLTVESLKDKPVKLRLLDSIPVSKTDKIEVKDLKISLEPATRKYLDREGIFQWELTLKPGEKQEITIDFTVTYPKDAPLPVF